MSIDNWFRALTNEEKKTLEGFLTKDCPNKAMGDCVETTYNTTMCPSCKAYYEAAAGMFGIPTETFIKDTFEEMKKQDEIQEVLESFLSNNRKGESTVN